MKAINRWFIIEGKKDSLEKSERLKKEKNCKIALN